MKALYALTNRCAGFGLQMAKGVQRALFLNRMARAAGMVPDQKQKPKKQKKVEAKLDVRPLSHPTPSSTPHPTHMAQATPPKFMYAKGEILKRRDAVGINVRLCLSIYALVAPSRSLRMYETSSSISPQTHPRPAGSESKYVSVSTF